MPAGLLFRCVSAAVFVSLLFVFVALENEKTRSLIEIRFGQIC